METDRPVVHSKRDLQEEDRAPGSELLEVQLRGINPETDIFTKELSMFRNERQQQNQRRIMVFKYVEMICQDGSAKK